jgi:dihydrofolate synthase / folylpolyglutamate synthase
VAVHYREAMQYVYALAPRGMELGLARMERALSLRGNPQRALPTVHVAGTNGKGSVATSMATVLSTAGYRVGLFTSPHLHRLVERFRIDGRPIAERTFARKVSELRPFLEHADTPRLTFFEVSTLIAFELFREARCDVVVLEVGLGGRYDSTNVVTPLVSVITSIALDHTDRLGPTFAHVAREKAGIIKPGVPVVSGAREPSAARVIAARAKRLSAPLLRIDREFDVASDGEQHAVRVGEQVVRGLRCPLAGSFQRDNLGCAVAALDVLRARFPLEDASLRRGLRRVRWPGRLELIEGAPSVLLDAAHNVHAADALAEQLATLLPRYARAVLVFGAMRDKDHAGMLRRLGPLFAHRLFTESSTTRAAPADELARNYGGEALPTPEKALARARKLAGKRGLIVVCGSIFVMAAARAQLLGLRADPPIAL